MVYYDRFFESEMLGKKLTTHFHQKFGEDARFVIILISKEYPLKDWTNWELSIAREREITCIHVIRNNQSVKSCNNYNPRYHKGRSYKYSTDNMRNTFIFFHWLLYFF